jgi:hypothetical protein
MLKYILLLSFLLPLTLLAQDATNTLPDNRVKKDTAMQTDLIDIGKEVFHIRPHIIRQERDKKIYFSFLPAAGNVPGGSGHALITSTTAAMYLGPRRNTNLSSANFAPYWNFKKRFGLPLRSSVWLANNSWNIQGDVRFLVYPQFTWGLGNGRPDDQHVLADNNYVRFYQSALKRITPYFFAGGGINIDYHSNIKSDDPAINLKDFTGYAYGTHGTSSSVGVNLSLLYDTRNNSINPLPGAYANLVYRINPAFIGSNDTWTSLFIDLRKYVPLNKAKPYQQNTLAFWSYFWTVFNANAPYLDLPSIGWDPYGRSGRGIDQNRYRGKSMFYFESEYRRDITDNGLIGYALFANVTTVSGTGELFRSWHPAAGPGLRIKFNKGSSTNIGIDYGFSKGYNTWLLNLGEAF